MYVRRHCERFELALNGLLLIVLRKQYRLRWPYGRGAINTIQPRGTYTNRIIGFHRYHYLGYYLVQAFSSGRRQE